MIDRPEDFVCHFDPEAVCDGGRQHAENLPEVFVSQTHSLIVPAPV